MRGDSLIFFVACREKVPHFFAISVKKSLIFCDSG